jgi:iron(III) transport system substrate-binding protein
MPRKREPKHPWRVLLTAGLLIFSAGCPSGRDPAPERVVTIYTSHDKVFSEPVLRRFGEQTGIRVQAKYDVEATKTIGLINALREEAKSGRTRCDVLWNNEPMNTIRLRKEGLLAPYASPPAKSIPATFKDPDAHWTGFAGRVRIIIVNTDLVPADKRPTSVFDLTKPEWKGKIGIAEPLFGTTATHVAMLWVKLGPERAREYLRDLKANDVMICGGNRDVARLVGSGRLAMGLTDTDDALSEKREGSPVAFVYPDSGEGAMGAVFLPNTVALVRGAPHPETARRLIDYLLSAETECALAASGSGQVPLSADADCEAEVEGPAELSTMDVPPAQAAEAFDEAMRFVEKEFLK